MATETNAPAVNAMVQKLLEAGGNVLMIGGYVGPSAEGLVRLYADLSLTKYIELKKTDIVRVQEPEKPDGPCIVFFKNTAEVNYAITLSMRADQAIAAVTSRCACGGHRRSGVSRESNEGNGGPVIDICEWSCVENLGNCVAYAQTGWQKFWCVFDYFGCRLICSITPIIV